MFRTILHAPLASLRNPSLSHLGRCTWINPRRVLISFYPNSHSDHRVLISNSGRMTDVLEILGPFNHIFPASDVVFYVGLLRKCIRSKDVLLGSLVHARLIKIGLESQLLISNVLLDMYAKAGFLDAAVKLFDVMPRRDRISWCTLISGCVSNGFDLEAYSLFKSMYGSGLKPNHFVMSSVLKGCSASGILELGLVVHGLVTKSGLGFDRFVEIGLVDMYAKCGDIDNALKLFYEIPVKNPILWNAMISGYCLNGFFIQAAQLCQDMCRVGFVMDLVTLRIVAGAASVLEMFDLCKNLHVYSIKIGLDTDSFVVAELLRLLTKLGEVDYMGKLFRMVRKPDVSLYSLLISEYHLHGQRVEAVKLAEELLILDKNPKQGALVSVLNLCLWKEEGTQIHAYILKTGHFSNLPVGNALISMYTKFGEMMDANVVFHKMPFHDVVSWTTIMAGLVRYLQFGVALETFDAFRKTGIQPDLYSVATIMNACAGLGDVDMGKQIHALALKLGFEHSDFATSSMVHMYAKCGYIESASRLFFHSPFSHNLIMTNIMLAGYCWNFLPDKALKLFHVEYRSGLIPDQLSFTTILGACADVKSKMMGELIHCCIAKSGYEFSDVIIGNAIINFYLKSGCVGSACKYFYSMRSWNANSYTMLMLGYIQNRGSSEALRLFCQMQKSGLQANPISFARILRGCADLSAIDLGKQIHASIVKMGLVSDVFVDNALVTMYAKTDDMDTAGEPFDAMSIGGDVMKASVTARFPQSGITDRDLIAFQLFKLEEVNPHRYAFAEVVSNFCTSAASQMCDTFVLYPPIHSGCNFDVAVGNSMFDVGTKCRILENSLNMLDNSGTREVPVTFSQLADSPVMCN